MKTKEIRRNSSWKGKPRLRKKKRTLCIFLDSHSLRKVFKVFGLKDGPTRIVLYIHELLIIMYSRSVNSMCEYLYCCTVHLVDSIIITKPTNALIVCNLFLNHFFKTLSLLLHVSIAYCLSSSGSTYSS